MRQTERPRSAHATRLPDTESPTGSELATVSREIPLRGVLSARIVRFVLKTTQRPSTPASAKRVVAPTPTYVVGASCAPVPAAKTEKTPAPSARVRIATRPPPSAPPTVPFVLCVPPA